MSSNRADQPDESNEGKHHRSWPDICREMGVWKCLIKKCSQKIVVALHQIRADLDGRKINVYLYCQDFGSLAVIRLKRGEGGDMTF